MSTIKTPEFRVAYPNVFKARKNDLSGKDEFSVVALFPKGADLTVLKKAAEAVAIKKWGADKKAWPTNLRLPFRDQGERAKSIDGKTIMPDGYTVGATFINLKSANKPGVVDQNVEYIMDEKDFYSGCWAKASVGCYAYDNKGNRGISFGLRNIQKTKDDATLGGRTKPEEDFEAVAGSGEASTSAESMFD